MPAKEFGLSLVGAVAVLQSSILGPGLLGVPWAFAQCGGTFGIILLILFMLSSFLGMHLLAVASISIAPQCASLEPCEMPSFATVCRSISSPALRCAYDAGIVLACSGSMLSTLMILGDSLQPFSILSRNQWIIVLFCSAAFPLSCLDQLSFLRFSSWLSLTMVFYITILLVVSAATDSQDVMHEAAKWDFIRADNWRGILRAIPIFPFGFCGHMNVMTIASELNSMNIQRLDLVFFSALLIAASIYLVLCVTAYISFGKATPEDLLTQFDGSLPSVAARIGLTVVCVGYYPLLLHPMRRTMLSWQCFAHPRNADCAEQLLHEDRRMLRLFREQLCECNWLYWLLTVLIGGIALAIALTVASLGEILSLSGATGFNLLCNVCPAWLYLKVTFMEETTKTRWLAIALGAFGLLTIPMSIVAHLAH